MVDTHNLKPATGRLEFVDSLRGFALFGVFWANLLIFSGIAYMTEEQRVGLFDGPLDALAYMTERFFIEYKFMGLFSFLFGISFWLFLSRVRDRGISPTRLFYRRILWLFVFGAVHGWLLWCFDILRFYALWAVLLPLFVRTPPKRLLGASLTAGVLLPAAIAGVDAWVADQVQPVGNFDSMALSAFATGSYRQVLAANWQYDWYLTNSVGQIAYQVAVFGRLLLGLYVARTLDLGDLAAHRALLRRSLLAGGMIGLVGSTIYAGNLLSGDAGDAWLAFVRRLLVESGKLGMTLAYASGLALAFLAARWRGAIRLLAPLGQTALTCYLLQTVFGIWLFYGFARGPALMGQLGPAMVVALCLIGFGAQVGLAQVWMSRFRYGPAEWCWRSLTYGAFQPLRIAMSDSGHPHPADGAGRRR